MHRKKQISTKHWPVKYRRFKGCFGGCPSILRPEKRKLIKFPNRLSLTKDDSASVLLNCIDMSLNHPERIADFRYLEVVSIRCGIILRAYADEYFIRHGKKVTIYKPKDKKSEAVLRYLTLLSPDESYLEYDDLKCWNIKVFDKLDPDIKNTDVVKELTESFIPGCWSGHKSANPETLSVATAVAEILYNCSEHAYADDSIFQRWYLGAGEYPESNKFSICVFDRGQGFKSSMQKNIGFWGKITGNKDSDYLKKAIAGKTGIEEGENEGRGKGIPKSVEMIKNVKGEIEILSGCGKYSTVIRTEAIDRKINLSGSMISFYVPIETSEDIKW